MCDLGSHGRKPVLSGADPATIEMLGWGYYRDKDDMYYYGYGPKSFTGRIVGADHTTFEVIKPHWGDDYGKDKLHVYLNGVILPGADPATFVPPNSPYL